jgi:predicted DNA-binding transcriptional regulator AlpA
VTTTELPRCGDVVALGAFLREHGIVVSRRTIFNYVARGVFPPPFHLGRHALWSFADVAAAINRLREAVSA